MPVEALILVMRFLRE